MSRIRGSDTSPEVHLRAALGALGLRNDPEAKTPVGRPDLVFEAEHVAVFVDGCFWHGCPLHYARPRTREEFWSAKLVENVERDSRQSRALREAGWTVIRLWEHQIIENLDETVESVTRVVFESANQTWPTELRIRRVVPLADGTERREYVLLDVPTIVVETVEGPRVTAKARAKR